MEALKEAIVLQAEMAELVASPFVSTRTAAEEVHACVCVLVRVCACACVCVCVRVRVCVCASVYAVRCFLMGVWLVVRSHRKQPAEGVVIESRTDKFKG